MKTNKDEASLNLAPPNILSVLAFPPLQYSVWLIVPLQLTLMDRSRSFHGVNEASFHSSLSSQ
jgi:hypothetical protein